MNLDLYCFSLLSLEIFLEYSDNSTVALFYRYIVVSKHEKDLRLLLNRLRREAESPPAGQNENKKSIKYCNERIFVTVNENML